MAKILVLNGPNLNLLGTRETQYYGSQGLKGIIQQLENSAQAWGHELQHYQSNAESALIDKIQQAAIEKTDFLIVNFGAYTHTSIALRDALLAVAIPYIEVHLSNIYARESFRHHSYIADKAQGIITGFGGLSYELALQAAHHHLTA